MSKLIKAITTGLAAVAFSAVTAMAGDYPDRPIGVAVSYGAGGATDFQARIVTMVAGNEDMLGQPIYIVNKPGAGGRVGWNWFATSADTEGYMMSAYNVPHFIAQSIKGGVTSSERASTTRLPNVASTWWAMISTEPKRRSSGLPDGSTPLISKNSGSLCPSSQTLTP